MEAIIKRNLKRIKKQVREIETPVYDWPYYEKGSEPSYKEYFCRKHAVKKFGKDNISFVVGGLERFTPPFCFANNCKEGLSYRLPSYIEQELQAFCCSNIDMSDKHEVKHIGQVVDRLLESDLSFYKEEDLKHFISLVNKEILNVS